MKNWLRRNPSSVPLPQRLVRALSEVEIGDTLNYYKHCTSVYYQKLNGSN
jgi:hypothetical protein